MNGTLPLKTERLLLRRYTEKDAYGLYSDFGMDEMMYEYSGWNPYETEEAARKTVQQFIDSYGDKQVYSWAIESDGQLVGTVGAYDYNPQENSIEIGISIARKYWGNGFAGEVLQRVLSYLTIEEGIETVKAWCADRNIGSKKAMERAGMVQKSRERAALKIKDNTFDKLNYQYRASLIQIPQTKNVESIPPNASLITGTEELSRADGRRAFMALRAEAKANGIQDMTMDEIDEEIRQARYEGNKK